MKKILFLIIMFFTLFISISDVNANEGYFVVTAYYSPLPNQENYSYNVYTKRERTYDEEKRLQGEGIRGASGKKVFSGMLAAPKNYRFGTKIYLEGLGTGEVSDRGGAIVNKGIRGHNYDRIDIWMGYGDEGLRRATYWGKRTIKGKILSTSNKVNFNYKTIPIAKIKIMTQSLIIKKKRKIDIFKKKLTNKEEIEKLQKVLKDLKFYSGSIDGNYKNIIDSIYHFQLSEKIVGSIYSPGAGNYGPKTRLSLKKKFNSFLIRKEELKIELARLEKKKEKEKRRKKELEIKYNLLKEKSLKLAYIQLNNIGNPKFGDVSYGVRELQLLLKKVGYFNYKDTAIYGNITKKSIIAFQIENNIIKDKNELGAGFFGPKTKKTLKAKLANIFLKELVNKENINFGELALVIQNKI